MWAYQLVFFLRLILFGILAGFSYRFWIRSGSSGFLFLAIAFLSTVVFELPYLIYMLTDPFGVGFIRGVLLNFYPLIHGISSIAFAVLVVLGLRAIYFDVSGQTPGPMPTFSVMWHFTRRLFFLAMGIILCLSSPFLLFGGKSTIGIGIASIAIGSVCLWLRFHHRSPLTKTTSVPANNETASS